MKSPDVSWRLSSPAPCSAYDIAPEQSYPESFQRPWPPPYLYGLPTILLAAAIAPLTSSGAEAGATARPSAPSVASSPAGGDGEALGWVVGSNTRTPRWTWDVILRASPRETRPFTRSSDRRSHDFTRRPVCGPYWPSISVRSPTCVRYFCSVRTSDPRLPSRSVRSPNLASAALGSRRPRPTRPRANVRQRGTTDVSFLSRAYGVSCRARAERVALRRTFATIRPRPLTWASGSPVPCRPGPCKGFGFMPPTKRATLQHGATAAARRIPCRIHGGGSGRGRCVAAVGAGAPRRGRDPADRRA